MTAVWGELLPRLRELDGLFVNLDCALSTRGRPWRRTNGAFHFRADPRWAVRTTLDPAREHDPDLLIASLHWGPNMVDSVVPHSSAVASEVHDQQLDARASGFGSDLQRHRDPPASARIWYRDIRFIRRGADYVRS